METPNTLRFLRKRVRFICWEIDIEYLEIISAAAALNLSISFLIGHNPAMDCLSGFAGMAAKPYLLCLWVSMGIGMFLYGASGMLLDRPAMRKSAAFGLFLMFLAASALLLLLHPYYLLWRDELLFCACAGGAYVRLWKDLSVESVRQKRLQTVKESGAKWLHFFPSSRL